jgi:3-hydroxyacyl-CoA dehydrogenase
MQRLKPDVDIVKDILEAVLKVQPHSSFIQSLYRQYQERGGLSKKQLQGLYSKAGKIESIPQVKLATLEAIILHKHSKHKSDLPANSPLYTKNEEAGKKIENILARFPQHKRILFLKSKFDNNEVLSAAALTELDKFHKLLIHGK